MSYRPSGRARAVVPSPPAASRTTTAFALIGSAGRRLAPIDLFVAINLALFVLMCVFTYYARFLHYRGAANVWEFFVYATAIIIAVVLVGIFLRRYAFGIGLLTLVQIGVLAHFAGGFVQFETYRLYDCYLAGIRYDKIVHFFNAFVTALVIRHLFERRGTRLTILNRLAILLVVLGLGTVVEIIEYAVTATVPGSGVGDYANNMQDLVANLVGGVSCMLLSRQTPPRVHLYVSGAGAQPAAGAWPFERIVSGVEIAVLMAIGLGLAWAGPALAGRSWFVPAMQVALVTGLFYLFYLSPVRLHRDSLAERGLGTWRTLFVRTDNLQTAVRRFGWLALAGTTLILLLAEAWNPGWLARANWRAWALRAGLYLVSSCCQSLVFVGFLLVRLRRVLELSPAHALDGRRRLLIAGVAAVLFGTLHLPGPALTVLTTLFGFAVAWMSLRTPNVLAAAGCHALLGFLAHRVLELPLRIGAIYYDQSLHPMRGIIPLATEIIGHLY